MAENDKSIFNVSDRTDSTPAAVDLTELESAFIKPQAQNPDQPGVSPIEFIAPHETRSLASEFVGGLKAGWSQVGTDLRATAAMGLAFSGFEKDALELMQIVMERGEQDAKDFPKSIARIEDVDSVADLTRWAARSLGEQIPVIASMFIGGAGTQIMGRLVGKGALSLGAAPQLVAKFPIIFSGMGTVGTAAAIETGATAAELFQSTGQLEPEVSFVAGITKGALESIVPGMLASRLGVGPDVARTLSSRVMTQFEKVLPGRFGRALGIGATEMVTETLQEVIDIVARQYVDENYDWMGEDARSRILNAAAGGLFIGSAFGMASRGNRRQTDMEVNTPVMPPEFGIGNPDISVGMESTGLPAQQTLRMSEDPGELPSIQKIELTLGQDPFEKVQIDSKGRIHLPAEKALPSNEFPRDPRTGAMTTVIAEPGKVEYPSNRVVVQPRNEDVLSARPPTPEELAQRAQGYDPTQPPSRGNLFPGAKSPQSMVSEERRGPAIKDQPKFLIESNLNDFKTDLDIVDIATGKQHDWTTQPGGTAVFLRNLKQAPLSREDSQLVSRYSKFVNAEMKRMGMKDEKLILFANTLEAGGFQSGYSNIFTVDAYGHYGGFDNKVSIIGINLAKPQNPGQAPKMLSGLHEFGHFVVHRKFATAPIETQNAVLRAYQEALLRASQGDIRYLGPFNNPSSAAKNRMTIEKTFPLEMVGPVSVQQGSKFQSFNTIMDSNYTFSFDEFMAEQIASYYGRDIAERSHGVFPTKAREFFRAMAKELKALFDRASAFFGVDTTDAVRGWMDSMRRTKASIAQAALSEGEAKGIRENAEVLVPASNAEFIPPPRTASAGMGNLLKKLGVPGTKIREIRAFADKFDWFMDLFFNIQQIGQHNPHIRPLGRYLELVDQWYNFQQNWMGRADQRLREWGSLGQAQGKSLAQFLYAVDAMEYLTPAEAKAGVLRQPTDGELTGLASKYGVNEAGMQQYLRIKEDFDAVLNQIEQTSIRDIERTITDPPTKAQELANLKREMNALRARPYFPHARFGDFAVVVKDKKGGKTIHMSQFESKASADRSAPDLLQQAKREFPEAVARVDYIPKEVHGFRGLPPNLVAKIKEKLKLSDVQNEWLDNLIVEMAPSASFRHHLAKRMNTPGFSFDAQRAYASYFFHGARHLARIEYGPLMQEEVTTGMNQSISGLEEQGVVVDVAKRRRIQEYMANHLEHILNPKPDWAQLRSAAFLWYLGFNVSSAALNFTQPVMVGLPYLGARFGDAKAVGAMMRAVKDLQNVYKFREQDRVPDSLFKALDRAMKEGVVEESQAAELAATAQGGYLSKLLPGTKMQRGAQMMAHYGGWLFQQSERINRRVMFRAAWDLAMKQPNTQYLRDLEGQNTIAMGEMFEAGFNQVEARAYLAAKDAVNQTQFRYAQHARPKFMRGKKGVVFTFFMFTQSMLHFARYSPGNTRYLVMMLFMAGLMGLPGSEDLEAIARLLARNLLGKDFDVQREVRELVTGMLGDQIPPDLFLRGVGRVGFGLPALMDLLGLPKAQFDFSRRIGFGRIIPGLAELGAPGRDFDEVMSGVSQQAAGATFGIGFNIIKALSDDQLPANDFKRWERMMPTALGNVSRVLRYATEGRERSRTDATIVDYNITDPDHIAELALRAVGFQPTRVQREWDRIKMQREAEAYWTARRAIILKLWSHSFGVRDPDLRETALTDVRSYNAEVPFGVMKITGEQLAKSRKEHLRQIRLREAGIASTKAMRPLAREIGTLHPETIPTTIVDAEDVTGIR